MQGLNYFTINVIKSDPVSALDLDPSSKKCRKPNFLFSTVVRLLYNLLSFKTGVNVPKVRTVLEETSWVMNTATKVPVPTFDH